jgi:hypothetical protein
MGLVQITATVEQAISAKRVPVLLGNANSSVSLVPTMLA